MSSYISQYTFWPFLHQHFPKYVRNNSCGCFLKFYDVVLSRVVIIIIIIIIIITIIIIIIIIDVIEYSFMYL